MNLTDIGYVKRLMASHGITFQKKFGQNFLINPTVPQRIAEECGAAPEDAILEIGPGIGTMTQYLCEMYAKVVAVEIDHALIGVLKETLADYDNVTVIEGDIMKTDLQALFAEHFAGMRVTVCANLPYYITTPILMLLLESGIPLDNITVMIQKEVADRLSAAPGSAEYGAVTASVSYYASVERLFVVSAGNFLPAPKVDSAVVRMTLYKEKPVNVKSERMLFRVIRSAFGQRRKTLLNALSAGMGDFTKSELTDAIRAAGLNEGIRGEKLSVAQFAALADVLTDKRE
ncbi:MAG: 16S rRNA (adenine(1518)-N(6)/adenine(1519)-N(6))-dimethyltransferase RsmA [Clostridia bacterium]|nr:16S rRNA (adenine(1518)-N(6)/adenine(1519)-N(6))-dimethyltransferase RsmA [Clostridia bacterium]